MTHNWEKYLDTESEYWNRLQELYKANDTFPKKVVKGRNLHHKFLRSFSRAEGTDIDNDPENLVSLGLGDHFLAHWLLWKCSKTGWRRYTARAVQLMYKKGLKYLTFEAAELIASEWNKLERDLKLSEETRKKISKANTGKPSPNKGKKLSDEVKQKLSEAHKGKPHSNEMKKKLSEVMKGRPAWNKGKKHSEEAKKKISEALRGKPGHTKGKHWKLVDGKRVYY